MKTTIVYLIHLAAPIAHAQHYIGSAMHLEARIEQHRAGQGARLLQVAKERGISWEVARTWKGDRQLERRIKRRRNAWRYCPICKQGRVKLRGRHPE